MGDRSIVTWGSADAGGDSSAVQHQLKSVQQIQSSQAAFAAILGDGSVVTWGSADAGGDSTAVQHELKKVQQTNHRNVHLLQSWATHPSSRGAVQAMVATVVRSNIS